MYFDTLLKTSAPDKQPTSHKFPLTLTLYKYLIKIYYIYKKVLGELKLTQL